MLRKTQNPVRHIHAVNVRICRIEVRVQTLASCALYGSAMARPSWHPRPTAAVADATGHAVVRAGSASSWPGMRRYGAGRGQPDPSRPRHGRRHVRSTVRSAACGGRRAPGRLPKRTLRPRPLQRPYVAIPQQPLLRERVGIRACCRTPLRQPAVVHAVPGRSDSAGRRTAGCCHPPDLPAPQGERKTAQCEPRRFRRERHYRICRRQGSSVGPKKRTPPGSRASISS